MAIAEPQRRSAPAALRNREPIAEVLREWLPLQGLVLEIASGTGEHAVHLATRFPSLTWQPSDTSKDALASICAWRDDSALPNLLAPLQIDGAAAPWPIDAADALLCINMAHISPWAATLGVLDGGASILPLDAPLVFYGPWLTNDVQTAPSNLAFDAQLRSTDHAWGIRLIEDLVVAAEARGFRLIERRAMPANNFMLLLRQISDRR